VEDLGQVALRQRVLKNMSALSTETTLFGEKLSMPVALAPVGLCGMYAPGKCRLQGGGCERYSLYLIDRIRLSD
jgi:isopentenyl diphosphate isomerase/L-lactate dehydrogenase-like FMN-dependent dehydrogenase